MSGAGRDCCFASDGRAGGVALGCRRCGNGWRLESESLIAHLAALGGETARHVAAHATNDRAAIGAPPRPRCRRAPGGAPAGRRAYASARGAVGLSYDIYRPWRVIASVLLSGRCSLPTVSPTHRRRQARSRARRRAAPPAQMSSGSVLPAVTVDGKTSCSPTCSPTPNGEKRAGFPSTKHPQRLGLIDPQPVQNRSHVSACSRSCARADYDDVARRSGTDAIARAHPR